MKTGNRWQSVKKRQVLSDLFFPSETTCGLRNETVVRKLLFLFLNI